VVGSGPVVGSVAGIWVVGVSVVLSVLVLVVPPPEELPSVVVTPLSPQAARVKAHNRARDDPDTRCMCQ